ncbi:MAG: hypothetical protein SF002_07285 [Alphaproteobacteria bacterium]|nr:hypothetical protein [Alphaproteobacteria bacterium]
MQSAVAWGLGVLLVLLAPTTFAVLAFLALERRRKPRARLARWFDTGPEPRTATVGQALVVLAWRPADALPAPFSAPAHLLVLTRGTLDEAARSHTNLRRFGPGRFEGVARVVINRPDTVLAMLKARFTDALIQDDLYQIDADTILAAIDHARFMLPGVHLTRIEHATATVR